MSQKLSGEVPSWSPYESRIHAMSLRRVLTWAHFVVCIPPSNTHPCGRLRAFWAFPNAVLKKTLCPVRLFQDGRGPTKCCRPPSRSRVAWSWCVRRARVKYAGSPYRFRPAPNGPRSRPGAWAVPPTDDVVPAGQTPCPASSKRSEVSRSPRLRSEDNRNVQIMSEVKW